MFLTDVSFVYFHMNPHVDDYSAFRRAFILPLKEWYIIQCVTRPRNATILQFGFGKKQFVDKIVEVE